MASNYPTSLDSFTNPTSGDKLDSPSHSDQHSNVNDAVEALQVKIGIGASPAGSATVGHVLTAQGGGTAIWASAGGARGGGADQVFFENDITVSNDYTITTNKNAMSAGPLTIGSAVTVTVPSGSEWTIV